MTAGFYSWYTGTLVDGRITTQFDASAATWEDIMDDAGTMSMTLNLGDANTRALLPYVTAEPCRCFMACAYTDPTGTETFLAAGPIWSHAYDSSTRQLQVGGAGLWSYYDHRKVLPVLLAGINPASVSSDYTALWRGTVAKRLVQLAHTHTGGSVPVVFPADEASTDPSDNRSYPGYEMDWTGQMLRNLTSGAGGPEIQFNPRRKASDSRFIEWPMRIGTKAAPTLVQAGEDWQWDQAAVKGAVMRVSVQRDGSSMAQRAWAQGSGTDVGTLFGRADDATLLSFGYPLLETEASGYENEADQTVLDAGAAGKLAKTQRPIETWAFDVRRDDLPRVGSYSVGDWSSVNLEGDPYLPDGIHRGRLVRKSGDLSSKVTVEFAPTLGGANG